MNEFSSAINRKGEPFLLNLNTPGFRSVKNQSETRGLPYPQYGAGRLRDLARGRFRWQEAGGSA
jgi:hypothetical protein